MISKIRLPIQALAVLLCATTASAQENRGTPEQRAACAPDAFRFCVGYIPDPTSVEQCLRQNKSESQRRVPIGVRAERRPCGQQKHPENGPGRTNSSRDIPRGRVSQQ